MGRGDQSERQDRKGPVPVRDLMRRMGPDADHEVEPAYEREDRTFEAEGGEWTARVAGRGAYGSGARGTARLLAVHFYQSDDLETPLREALIPAAAWPGLHPEELADLLGSATPIDLDR